MAAVSFIERALSWLIPRTKIHLPSPFSPNHLHVAFLRCPLQIDTSGDAQLQVSVLLRKYDIYLGGRRQHDFGFLRRFLLQCLYHETIVPKIADLLLASLLNQTLLASHRSGIHYFSLAPERPPMIPLSQPPKHEKKEEENAITSFFPRKQS